MAMLSGYGPHTAAKHRILSRYLEAWLPIMSGLADRRRTSGSALVLIDGFAGSGRYDTGQPGSPLVMLNTYMEHSSRERIAQTVHFVFIEKNEGFVEHLWGEIPEERLSATKAVIDIRHGLFAEQLPRVLEKIRSRYGGTPATFAFIDPFGLKDNTLELTSGLAIERGCEVLAYLPTGFMARFESTEEFAPALDHLYGGREEWADVKEIEVYEERRTWLRNRFGEVLSAQTKGHCLSFDIQPQGSSNIYSLVFSSQNRKGVQRMKEAMWKVDPVSGQFFRGGLRARQTDSLFDLPGVQGDVLATHVDEGEPDYSALEQKLRERFGTQPFGIQEAADYVLFETIFRDDKHLKGPVLAELDRQKKLTVVSSPRKRSVPGAYPDGTILRFVD